MKLKLQAVWNFYCKLRAEGDKLWAEGDKLRAEGDKLWAEGDKLWAEGDKLRAEGDKLRAEGDKLWAEGVLKIHGNITIEWKYLDGNYDCLLGNGEHYKFKKVRATLASARRSTEQMDKRDKRK